MLAADGRDEVAAVVDRLVVGCKRCAAVDGEKCGGVLVDEPDARGEAGLQRRGCLEVVDVERGVGTVVVEVVRLDGVGKALVRAGRVWDGGEGGDGRRD